jgi:hypothetical protein
MERILIARKCSQCRQEGCNKSKATCPVNAEKASSSSDIYVPKKRRCALCRREGCCRTNLMCPVKIEIERHNRLAFEMAPVRSFIVGVSPIDVKPDLYDHIQDLEEREKQFNKLKRDIIFRYEYERFQYIERALIYRGTPVENPVVVPRITVNVHSNYVKCEGECGICYENKCNVMLNCKHEVCLDCFKGQIKVAQTSRKLNCAFCRTDIKSINAGDANTYKLLID